MSYNPKGCLRRIIARKFTPSTSCNKDLKGGGTLLLTLACRHRVTITNSRQRVNQIRFHCWQCVREREINYAK